jgi:hypothetical protein
VPFVAEELAHTGIVRSDRFVRITDLHSLLDALQSGLSQYPWLELRLPTPKLGFDGNSTIVPPRANVSSEITGVMPGTNSINGRSPIGAILPPERF